MDNIMNTMIFINLHEVDLLEETLATLAEEYVRDCVVYNAEGVASRHNNETIPEFGFAQSALSSLISEKRNPNYVILAVTQNRKIDQITRSLKLLHKENRMAASFWFIPISGYVNHKGDDD
ncbi:MAG: hypothetical protein ABIH39_02135 [Candidatus Margulisiibacteriota bacterium]